MDADARLKDRLLEANLIRWTAPNRWLFAGGVAAFIFLLVLPFTLFAAVSSGEPSWYLSLLLPGAFAVGFGLMYMAVGKKMDGVRARAPESADLQSDCLMVRDAIQSPGIAQIIDGHLLLTPLAGKKVKLPLGSISVREVAGRFNGALYPGQTAFWLDGPDVSWRLGFAVPDGAAWRPHFAKIQAPD